MEDSCCGTLRVAAENHSSRKTSSSSLIWQVPIIRDLTSIGKVPLSFTVCRSTAGCIGSYADQSCSTSSNICHGYDAVVGEGHTVADLEI